MVTDERTKTVEPRLKSVAGRVATGVAAISRWLNVLGILVLGALIAVTVLDVLGRSILKRPILGTFELTEYMLSVIVFSTVAWCAVAKSHIKVDIVTSHLSGRVQAIMGLLTHILSLGLLVVITWQCIVEALAVTEVGKSSTMLNVPAYPFYWLMSLGLLVLCLQLLVEIFQYGSKVRRT